MHHSRHGGMWIDRLDWRDELNKRHNRLGDGLSRDIERFVRDGVIIYEDAADLAAVDAFDAAITKAFREGSDELICQLPGDPTDRRIEAGTERRRLRVVDAFVKMPEALSLLSSPKVVSFLSAIFGEDPLLFQSLSFDRGSEQGLHQDTAYVVVDRPLELAACWIALEDVQPGSGELQYIRGSHRLPDADFFSGRKHYNPELDTAAAHDDWSNWIVASANERGLPVERFLAKKGDILIWHADLAHGGSPIENPDQSRRSLVGHFCPISAKPHHFNNMPNNTTILRHGRMGYNSSHYELAPAAETQAA